MELIMEYLNSERSLFLFAGVIGVVSLVVGLSFLLFSNHKSFAMTMLVLGILEMVLMFPTYLNYPEKIADKISVYESNGTEFLAAESASTEKALKSFLWLKLIYGLLIVVLGLAMSFLSSKSMFFGIFTALVLHLAFAITIDNFGEKYAKKYLIELSATQEKTS